MLFHGRPVIVDLLRYPSDFVNTSHDLRYCNCFVLCHSVTETNCLFDAERNIDTIKRSKDTDEVLCLFMHTKCDLDPTFNKNNLDNFIVDNRLDGYLVTSAKTGLNCKQALDKMVRTTIYRSIPHQVVKQVAQRKPIQTDKHCIIN